jgi:hypothetical protein
MARIRTIKPEFWTAEQVMELSRDARLLFVGMWNFCDDQGVHPAALKTLKAEVFPGDDITGDDVKRMIDEIIAQGLLCEFEHENRRWWHVTGWKHQLINRPTPSRYPRPPRIAPPPLAAGPDGTSGKGLDEQFQPATQTEKRVDCVTTHGGLTEDSRRTHGGLTEDSLQERKGREGKGKERKGEEQKPAQQASSEVQARDPVPAAVAAVRFDAAKFLVEQGADSQTAADYLVLRKGKKAASTVTALNAVVTEAAKAGLTTQAVLELCCSRGWVGFKAEWAAQQARAGPPTPAKFDPVAYVNRNRTIPIEASNIIDITAERLA